MGMRSVKYLALPFCIAVFSIFAFQNCAGPTEVGSDPSVAAAQKRANEAPFAYDVTVNRFAYMSCVNGPQNSSRQLLEAPTFFSFKVVAADDLQGDDRAGLKLADDFVSFAEERLPKRRNEDGEIKVERSEVKKLLKEARRSAGTRIQLAVRPVQNTAEQIMEPAEEGKGFSYIMPDLNEDLVLDQIAQLESGKRLNYVDGGKGISGRHFEGAIGFFEGEEIQDKIRRDISNRNKAMVTLTYRSEKYSSEEGGGSTEAEALAARSPYSFGDSNANLNTAYGLGFQPFFSQADSRNALNPLRVLREVREFDLTQPEDERSNKAEWVCDPSLRYMIFSPEDAENSTVPVNCPRIPDPLTSTNPAVVAEMKMLRSVLPEESWYINIPGKCIVPKETRGDCYPKDLPVQYETAKDCGVGQDHDCAHFLSICYRLSNH